MSGLDVGRLASARPLIRKDDPLVLGLNLLAGKTRSSPYRVVVVDEEGRVQGVLTGRRLLEILMGYRGASLMRKEGIHGLLREPVHLFIDEAMHIFTSLTPVSVALQYMAENNVGYVIITDEREVVRGVLDERAILTPLAGGSFDLAVREVMSRNVYTIGPHGSILDAAKMMVELRVRRLPVTEHGRVKGIVTTTDVLSHVLSRDKYVELITPGAEPRVEELLSGSVEDIMSKRVVCVEPEVDVGVAIAKMLEHDISGMPVIARDGRLCGVVSRVDVIAGLTRALGAQQLARLVSR